MKILNISKKAISIIVLATTLFWVSCAEEKKEEPIEENSEIGPAPGSDTISGFVDTVHTSQNSLDYAGTYKGVTPCADCGGIATELTLNMDSTFVLFMQYEGKGKDAVVNTSGKYIWMDGSIVELVGIKDGPARFKVGEGRIWQLDMSGKMIEGALADKYILKKS